MNNVRRLYNAFYCIANANGSPKWQKVKIKNKKVSDATVKSEMINELKIL